MSEKNKKKLNLEKINSPADLKGLNIEDLKILSSELREELIEIVSKTGGHLGAGLGVVELTVALHFVFNSPKDKLIWDVGHQAYPHKILTGRRKDLHTLRQKDGISGFLKRSESIHDHFGAGHSSTSISAGLGMAVARDIKKEKNKVIAVIGDGAMSAGLAYEGMNNAGILDSDMIIILNDNRMSIAPAVGALSNYLSKIVSSEPFNSVREIAKKMVEIFPQQISQTAKKAEDIARNILTQDNTFFSQMGMFYLGPIDGHDVETLVKVLKNLNNGSRHGPILLHVVTEKGKGHPFSKVSDEKYHAVSKFNVVTGNSIKSSSNVPTYTEVFADTLCNIAEDNEKITAITAAMPSGTGLNKFKEKFENRFFDVGIAEQHAVTFAAGLASQGIQPFVAIYSTFLQRAYDQVIHDVVIQKLPVKFMLDRAGLVGADGSTHAGAFDLAYLLCLPNVVVMAPSDENELKDMVYTSSLYNSGPIFCRYPRGEATGMEISKKLVKLPIGKGRIIKEGTDIAILSIGTLLETALEVTKKLQSEGYDLTVADARFAKPIDEDLLLNLYKNHKILFIVEEGSRGGFSSHCLNIIASSDLLNTNSKIIRTLNLPDLFQEHASQNEQLIEANLDINGIYNKIKLDIESQKIKLNLKINKGYKNN